VKTNIAAYGRVVHSFVTSNLHCFLSRVYVEVLIEHPFLPEYQMKNIMLHNAKYMQEDTYHIHAKARILICYLVRPAALTCTVFYLLCRINNTEAMFFLYIRYMQQVHTQQLFCIKCPALRSHKTVAQLKVHMCGQ